MITIELDSWTTLQQIEKAAIKKFFLDNPEYTLRQAANKLGIAERTIYRKLDEYDLKQYRENKKECVKESKTLNKLANYLKQHGYKVEKVD